MLAESEKYAKILTKKCLPGGDRPSTSAANAASSTASASEKSKLLRSLLTRLFKGKQGTLSGPLQQSVDDVEYDDVVAQLLWPPIDGPQPGGLPPAAFKAVVEMIMAWMTDSLYNPQM
ncbi:hypothetical protein ABVT39_015304 [Epinephelus coioides]